MRGLGSRLYNGETTFRIVGRWKTTFALSAVVVLVGLASLGIRGLNLGIDFEGGVVWEVPAGDTSVNEVREALEEFGLAGATIQTLNSDEGERIRVEAEPLGVEREQAVADRLAEITGTDRDLVSLNSVGPSWGQEITEKAVRALVIFLVLITVYVSLRFEFKMAVATLAALVHDVLVTAGVYSLTGLEVTPATVISLLTILGYSIYDGIVVFDKVDENTRMVSSTKGVTYSDMVDLSLNQTLMRSLNTTITAVIPITSLLVVGSLVLGARTLQEFAVALLVGLASGAYSSIFIASPLLALLKEREPRYADVRRRIAARTGARTPATAVTAAPAAEDDVVDDESPSDATPVGAGARPAPPAGARPAGVIPPRPRKKRR